MATSPRRAALYARQSKDDPDGIDRQIPRTRELAARRGWRVVGEYTDDGVSASRSRGTGTGWARMLDDAAAGRIDTVIAVDLDRLLRSTRDLITLVDFNLMAVTVDGEIDLSTADGEFRATMLAAIARFEVRRKAERQSRGQMQRAQLGRPPKGTRPLGYTTAGDVIGGEARAVREIYRLFAIADGPSIAAIAKGLSGETGPLVPQSLPHLPRHTRTLAIERNRRRAAAGEDPHPVPDDGRWTPSTVLGILRNPRYAGYSVYTDRTDRGKNKRRSWHTQILRGDDGDPVMGQWTALVDEETWWAVQERLNAPERITNRSGSTKRKHLGSSLYRCGVCGDRIVAHSRGYRCAGHVTRSRPHVDDFVLRVVRERLSRPDLADVIPSRDEPRIQEIRDEISQRRGRIKRAQSDYDSELIQGFDLKRIRDAENALIEKLEDERRGLMTDADLGSVLGAADPVTAFDDADLAVKRRVIDALMDVYLLSAPRGRKTFDPATVRIVPKAGCD